MIFKPSPFQFKKQELFFGRALMGATLIVCWTAGASAELVTWTVAAGSGVINLYIPDQDYLIPGFGAVHIGIRDGSGDYSEFDKTWRASMDVAGGTLETEWTGHSFQFVSSGITLQDRGSYRPNPAAYTGGTVNPDGTASGGTFSNTSAAPAEVAGVVQIGPSVTVPVAHVALDNIHLQVSSGLGTPDRLVATAEGQYLYRITYDETGFVDDPLLTGTARVLVDGVFGTVIPDLIYNGSPGSGYGSATRLEIFPSNVYPNGANASLDEAFSFDTVIDVGGIGLNAHILADFLAFGHVSIVPEPSSIALLSFGAGLLLLTIARKKRTPKGNAS